MKLNPFILLRLFFFFLVDLQVGGDYLCSYATRIYTKEIRKNITTCILLTLQLSFILLYWNLIVAYAPFFAQLNFLYGL